jgi:hypothetical protein
MKAYSNQDAHEQASLQRIFSALPGSATTRGFPNYGVVLQLASLLANVSSFSGFLTIEKTIEQPNFVLHFLDLIGTNVRDNQQASPVFPTVGPTRYDNSAFGLQSYRWTNPANQPDNIILDNSTFRAAAGIAATTPIPPIMPYTIKIVVRAYNNANQLLSTEVFADNGNRVLVNLGLSVASANPITIGTPPHIDRYGNPALLPNSPNWDFSIQGTQIQITVGGSGVSRTEAELSFAFNYTEPIYYPGREQDERFTLNLTRVVSVNTKPAKLTIELNKQELAAISKSMSQDLQPVIVQRVGEIYNKMVNRYIVRKYIQRFIDNYSNIIVIDVGSPLGGPASNALQPYSSYDQYIPILDRARGGFERVRQELHRKSYIANKPTALLVSPKLAYFLARSIMVEQSLWVEEKVTYINDLFGYYIGIPVLVHTELETLDTAFEQWARNNGLIPNPGTYVTAAVGFAVAILPDNNLAPMVRATFLPPTNTPTVANFNNPLQEAFSMFYQEEVDVVAPELVVPFALVNMPVS